MMRVNYDIVVNGGTSLTVSIDYGRVLLTVRMVNEGLVICIHCEA